MKTIEDTYLLKLSNKSVHYVVRDEGAKISTYALSLSFNSAKQVACFMGSSEKNLEIEGN